jgi:hypothetical protein
MSSEVTCEKENAQLFGRNFLKFILGDFLVFHDRRAGGAIS